MIVKLLNEHHLEFVSLKGGCTWSSESTLVKKPNCWKLHATARISFEGDFLCHTWPPTRAMCHIVSSHVWKKNIREIYFVAGFFGESSHLKYSL